MATITSTATKNPNTVYGKVTDANERAMPNLKVEIYNVDIRNWQLLSSDFTDRDGN